MTILENNYHRTETMTRTPRRELSAMAGRISRGEGDRFDLSYSRQVRRRLCGNVHCRCGCDVFGALGETEVQL